MMVRFMAIMPAESSGKRIIPAGKDDEVKIAKKTSTKSPGGAVK
jgi:hypothetical protein